MEKDTGIFIAGFIAILIGISFTTVLGDSIYEATNLRTVNDTGLTLSSGQVTADNLDIVSLSFFGNQTNNTNLASVTVGTDVNFTKATGVISAGTNKFPSTGPYHAVYTHEPVGYVVDTSARTFLALVMVFFVIGVFGIAMGMGVMALQKTGMM